MIKSNELFGVVATKDETLEENYNQGIIRGVTASNRVLPNFIIIGEQKCGTSTLYDNLIQHPQIIPALRKEIHFFDNWYHIGLNMYRAFFPTNDQIPKNNLSIIGEASPNYFHHPLVPKRIKENLPNVKLIVLFRNPVERAYSHFNMMKNSGYESLSFEEAIEYEKHVFKEGKISWMLEYRVFNQTHHPYLLRGIYVNSFRRWLEFFPRNQILVINSEDLKSNKSQILEKTFEFLNVPSYNLGKLEDQNVAKYDPMNSDTKKMLEDFFKPYNQELYDLLNIDFHW
jgi:hypothetical protein